MERQHVFLQLKPACVNLLQVTATLPRQPNTHTALTKALTTLTQTLQTIISQAGPLDAKLTEYVFVPISQVLRISGTVPIHALELCLECILLLLQGRWGGALAPELSGQLLILFTFMAKPSSAENGISNSSEELQGLALKCTAELLLETSRSPTGKQYLIATSSIPALGEAVLVILDSLTNSPSGQVKLDAVGALRSLIAAVQDKDALASFFPRVVSSLTRILTPTSNNRINFRVLENCLQCMKDLFLLLLSDKETRHLPKSIPNASEEQAKTTRSLQWLQATASQIKLALSNVLKLRQHEKPEIQKSLLSLCLAVVQDCRKSLVECTGMAIETMVTLAGRGNSGDDVEVDLQLLLRADQELSALLLESLYGWMITLPRLMQSKDDTGRRQLIHQIAITLRLLNRNQVIIGDLLADHLRDGVSSVLEDSKMIESMVKTQPLMTWNAELGLKNSGILSFGPFPFRLKGQQDLMGDFSQLLAELAKSDTAVSVAQDLVNGFRTGPLTTQLANLWIAINLVRGMMEANPSIDDLIDFGTQDPHEESLDSLYSHSLEILAQQYTGHVEDWRMSALALEAIAMQAERYKIEFRAELSEILYPVLFHLGSPTSELRIHAATCLNIVSDACGYSSASELVIANVDYVVNAVGLRLSYGDVSPQAPQVLLMMMRLCGPSLLPYLDDLVGAIFGALERYHGYPKLVELLFAVLKGMVEEGVKAPQLCITASNEPLPWNEQQNDVVKMHNIIDSIRTMEETAIIKQSAKIEDLGINSFPRKPWNESTSLPLENEETELQSPEKSPQDKIPPEPLTFSILLKISDLTQYYLTSSSPSLRSSLISLLQTTIPALAKHEDSFLPLINTLWPVLVSRLEDPEAYVVANVLEVVSLMCELAKGFMRSRIDAIWDSLKVVYRRTTKYDKSNKSRSNNAQYISPVADRSMLQKSSSNTISNADAKISNEVYVTAPAHMIRESLIHLLCSIVKHVEIREEQFDDALNMLESVLERPDVKETLWMRNTDLVWLRLHRRGRQEFAAKVDAEIRPESARWRFTKFAPE
ncbi:unnamed protein product [Periconia digitata]|uniref:ARM repeat-containing protein n=1 Tax=Periconia digitata TaxID=1303443 RepID=A0A9W4UJ66_9PLEO|nr:unnamed protein product [Periconia digitata]